MRYLIISILLSCSLFAQDSTKAKINEYKKDLKIIQAQKQKLVQDIKDLTTLENFHLYKIKSLTDSTRTKK